MKIVFIGDCEWIIKYLEYRLWRNKTHKSIKYFAALNDILYTEMLEIFLDAENCLAIILQYFPNFATVYVICYSLWTSNFQNTENSEQQIYKILPQTKKDP